MPTQSDPAALDRLRQFDGDRRAEPPRDRPVDRPRNDRPQPRPDQLDQSSGSGELAASVFVPGLPSIRRHPMLGIVLFLVGVAGPLVLAAWVAANKDDLVGFALDPQFLLAVTLVAVGAVLVRLLAVAEVFAAHRRSPGIAGRAVFASILVLALGMPAYWVAYRAYEARSVVADVFAGGSDEPIFVPTAPAVDQSAYTNVLLFGGDAGPGRWGLRTDTMILVTVHRESGRTALVSIPRNLTRLQFPPDTPLAATFPNGFDDLANAVFPYVSTNEDLMGAYGRDGLQAEAVALSEAIGYSLDIEVDDFALVNMQGFTDVIDAVGGVTLELGSTVELPPTIPGERELPPSIGPGPVDMDGALAIAYVRTRYADSDYQRMGRQRQLLAALGSQVSATEAITGFSGVTSVLDESMRTSLSSGEFSDLLDRLGDNSAIQESVGLIPPLIEPGSPDYGQIRTIIAGVQSAMATGNASGYAN
jgi:LCP family protein required for cell wall assembly